MVRSRYRGRLVVGVSTLTALLLWSSPSRAGAVDVALNVGVIEAMALPSGDQIGVYPSLGLSLAIPTKHVTLIPGVSVEVAPETRRWGFVVTFVADFPVSEWMGLDVDVTMIHDQPGTRWADAEILLGGGVGCSWFLGKTTLSPFLNVFRDLTVPGWALVPGVNLALTLN